MSSTLRGVAGGNLLKATDTKPHLKPIKMALRTGDKVSTDPEELLTCIKSLNPRLHIENWTILNSKDEPTGGRLVLLVVQDSANTIKRDGYKTSTGLSEGTSKVLSDPTTEPGVRAAGG